MSFSISLSSGSSAIIDWKNAARNLLQKSLFDLLGRNERKLERN